MNYDVLPALALFAFVSSVTPGPNNLMLIASGANFGLRRSLPHMAGVAYGLPLMIIPVGFGVMQLFEAYPPLFTLMKGLAVLFVIWLAWKVARAAAPAEAKNNAKPLSFFQAVAFQWVNPKAWWMALGALTLYAQGQDIASVLWVAATFAGLGMVSTTTWVTLGAALRTFLGQPARLRIFNHVMAGLLLLSMVPVLLQ